VGDVLWQKEKEKEEKEEEVIYKKQQTRRNCRVATTKFRELTHCDDLLQLW